jgi:VPS inhibitor protein E
LHPHLHVAIEKYQVVCKLKNHLAESTTSSEMQRLAQFKGELTEKNKKLLSDRRDSNWGAWFLEQVFHVLTFGVYSKLTKGTFQFWKSHGEAFVENEHELLVNDRKDSAP